ncbi:MAG: CopG family transcriptional regulator [Spirochaetes bacterium]|nr:CopG family transcriptional regulator [Spirochaetota bacterium]
MKRTQVYLTQNEHKALTQLSRRTKKKRSEIIREAIDAHLARNERQPLAKILDEVAGTWQDNTVDFDKIRKSWNSQIA